MSKTKSGSYRLFVSGGFDGKGKRIRYTKTIKAKSPKEAEKILSLFIAECEKGIENLSNCKLSTFADHWLEEYVKKNLAQKTIDNYNTELKNRIIPALGNVKLKELKPLHIIKFYNGLETAKRLDKKPGKLSGRTKQNIHRILSSMLSDAVKWQVISENPATRVEPPKNPKKKAHYYEEDHAALLLTKLDEVPLKWKVATYIALFTGMRKGEILGLEWSDIDFNSGVLNIERTSIYTSIGVITKSPKNETSSRIIIMPKMLIDILKQYKSFWNEQKLQCGDKWLQKSKLKTGDNDVETNRLFVQWDGEPMFPGSYTKWFSKFISRNNKKVMDDPEIEDEDKDKYLLPKITPHGLRHTCATLLINQGLNVKAISARLGHADTTTTLNIYSHALKSADKEAADRLDNLFEKKPEKDNKKKTV